MLQVIKSGLLTSVQDLGRYGYQKYGVIASGVMDPLAHRIANLLVGNEETKSTLEITLLGPVLLFKEDALIALCGADLSPTINGEPVRMWRTFFVRKGSELKFGANRAGCRTYLSIAGGFNVPSVMNSQSTYLRAEIGGFQGRMLKAGDKIAVNSMNKLSAEIMKTFQENRPRSTKDLDWSITTKFIPPFAKQSYIRVMPGRQHHLFDKASVQAFYEEDFIVTSESDRMGYRLKGRQLHLSEPGEMISEAVAFGSIQVPSDGNPIVLLADRQTTGGYPKIGQIATVDFTKIAQAKPGDLLRFMKITHEEAQQLYLELENSIQQLKQGILFKVKAGK